MRRHFAPAILALAALAAAAPAAAQPMMVSREAPAAAFESIPGFGAVMARDLRFGTRLRWQPEAAPAGGRASGRWFVSLEGEATGDRRLTASSLFAEGDRGAGVVRGLAGYRVAELGRDGGIDLLAGPLISRRTGRAGDAAAGRSSAGFGLGADLLVPGLLPGFGTAPGPLLAAYARADWLPGAAGLAPRAGEPDAGAGWAASFGVQLRLALR